VNLYLYLVDSAGCEMRTGCSISWEMYPKLTSESVRLEQEDLDIRTLHLLRATVHNEERKLPENWEENPSEHRKYDTQSCCSY